MHEKKKQLFKNKHPTQKPTKKRTTKKFKQKKPPNTSHPPKMQEKHLKSLLSKLLILIRKAVMVLSQMVFKKNLGNALR